MMTLRRSLIVATMFVLVGGASVGPSPVAAADGVLSGELVVLDGSPNRFRLVGHDGSFTAPGGVPLAELDGKNVEIDVSHGKVMRITERPVAVDPVTSGFETVRGQVMVRDSAARTFNFAGDDHVYVAPAGVDVSGYAGKWVELKLDQNGQAVTMNVVAPAPQSALPPPAMAVGACQYGGAPYSPGATVCQSGTQYRCGAGAWQNLGAACTAPAVVAGIPAAPPRTCLVGDATVASGSSVCREGTTYRCSDGSWVSLQTACR